MTSKHVAFYITGGIAAYKAAYCVREFVKHGYEVRCAMTKNAAEFVSPLTFETLCKNKVVSDLFDQNNDSQVAHIDLADWTDLAVVVPATADIIGKMANGIADDAVSTSLLATAAPVFVVSAMNEKMLTNLAVKRNLKRLKEDGIEIIEPDYGFLAEGYSGKGRMKEPREIFAYIDEKCRAKQRIDLSGKKIIVTAGGTVEPIDPVRFLTNRSSGKMGYALAENAAAFGADVTLVHGPVRLADIPGVEMVETVTADEMASEVLKRYEEADVVIMAAAVADYRPEKFYDEKVKKSDGDWNLRLVRNVDILKLLGEKKTKQKLVGFAAETENLLENAQKKLTKKNVDLLVANDVSRKDIGFGSDENEVFLLFRNGAKKKISKTSKEKIAQDVLSELSSL